MIAGKYTSHVSTLAILGWVTMPHPALACAACFGKSDDAMARGMNMGIFTLLLVVLSVLTGLASFGVFLARRSARFSAEMPRPVSYSQPSPKSSQTFSQPTQ